MNIQSWSDNAGNDVNRTWHSQVIIWERNAKLCLSRAKKRTICATIRKSKFVQNWRNVRCVINVFFLIFSKFIQYWVDKNTNSLANIDWNFSQYFLKTKAKNKCLTLCSLNPPPYFLIMIQIYNIWYIFGMPLGSA